MRRMLRWLAWLGLGLLGLAGLAGLGLIVAEAAGVVRTVAIASNSMAPLWRRGALLVLAPEPAKAVRIGQAIAWLPPPSVFPGLVVHQVVMLEHASRGLLAQTKGLANPGKDPWLDNLSSVPQVWHVVAHVPAMGYVAFLLNNWHGIALVAFVAVGLALAAYAIHLGINAARPASSAVAKGGDS